MIPILYEKNEKSFTSNGIGRLSDVISCVVTEVKNGEYSLEMEYPSTGKYFEELKEERIIYAKPNDGEGSQPFSIFRISKPINGKVSVSANHISYLLNKMIVMPYEADTCQEALSQIPANVIGGTNFTFWTDKSVIGAFKSEIPRAVRGLLGGEQDSILQKYGKGEYEFDHFAVKLHVNRGADYGVTIRYGKNITDLENTLDMSNVYTGIVPYWKSEDDILTLPEKVLWSNYTRSYAYNLAKEVDFTSEWQDKPTVNQLRTRAQKYLTDNEGWVLQQNITLSFVHLADTEEYKDIEPLERVRLCDTVTIIDTPLGVNLKAKVIKTIYNTLLERYVSVEIGETQPNLRTVIEEQIREPIIQATSSRMQQAIKYATDLITGVKGGYLIINTDDDGTPTELLIMNHPDKNKATQVLRINMNGIGFGKSYNGPFNTAWTLDGHFVANFIDTGTLTADVIKAGVLGDKAKKNYWNMVTGEFSLSAGAKVGGNNIANTKYVDDTAKEKADNAVSVFDKALNQEKVFNKLTNNGQTQGIYLYKNRLYINADYIKSGTISADLIKSGTMSANRIIGGTMKSANGLTYFDMEHGILKVYGANGYYDGGFAIFSPGSVAINYNGKTASIGAAGRSFLNGLQINSDGLFLSAGVPATFRGNAYFYGDVKNSSGGTEFVSDRNKKKSILDLAAEKAKEFITGLRPRIFKFKEGTSGRFHHGFIAQEVYDAMEGKDWGVYTEWEEDGEKTCGIRPDEIIADLVAVVQMQQKKIDELEDRIIALEGRT